MKTLLHVCCGPCASACTAVLAARGGETALFFSNSNIDTRGEFELRLENARRLAAADGLELIADEYDHDRWLEEVARGFEDAPERGARCERCFRHNLRRAAECAARLGFDAFTTSLTVSPHKSSAAVFAAGRAAAGDAGPRFLEEDFKKKDGFLRSLRRSAALGLYRQDYCGCEFSRRTAGRISAQVRGST